MLTQLPSNLEKLSLGRNHFSGSLDLTKLPPILYSLGLNNNAFSGTVDLSQLPEGLEAVILSNNELSGEAPEDILFRGILYAENTKIIQRYME